MTSYFRPSDEHKKHDREESSEWGSDSPRKERPLKKKLGRRKKSIFD